MLNSEHNTVLKIMTLLMQQSRGKELWIEWVSGVFISALLLNYQCFLDISLNPYGPENRGLAD